MQSPAPSEKEAPASSNEGLRLPKWITFERMVSFASLAFAAGSLLTTVNAQSRRIDKLEERQEAQATAFQGFQVRAEAAFATLLERTDPSHKHP